tara:strand:- start:201 stop:1046 length:846 start_codon:yes stop_codon:yes gene_type:complete
MTTSNYVNIYDSKFITISGNDSANFLQGIMTNNINNCNLNESIYSCLLSPQGKFLADFFIIQLKDKYLIEINKKFKDEFLKKINIYKLRSKITINENNEYVSLLILNYNNQIKNNEDIIAFPEPRKNNLGTKMFIKSKDLNNFLKKNNLKELSMEDYRELLIKNLIPYSPEDLIVNKSLLLENNFENLNAIDWHKGCYIGQEITARMKYRSLLKKKLRSLELLSGKIKPGLKIIYDEKEIGDIISCINKFAICMLKIEEANKIFKNNEILKSGNAILKIIK